MHAKKKSSIILKGNQEIRDGTSPHWRNHAAQLLFRFVIPPHLARYWRTRSSYRRDSVPPLSLSAPSSVTHCLSPLTHAHVQIAFICIFFAPEGRTTAKTHIDYYSFFLAQTLSRSLHLGRRHRHGARHYPPLFRSLRNMHRPIISLFCDQGPLPTNKLIPK